MKKYELTVLLHPDLEVDIKAPVDKLRKLIADNGGKIVTEENWGKKKLAYQIKKQDFAVYIYFEAELPAEALLKISNTLNITDDVLRYLLVTVDEKGRQALQEAKEAESKKTKEQKEEEGEK